MAKILNKSKNQNKYKKIINKKYKMLILKMNNFGKNGKTQIVITMNI